MMPAFFPTTYEESRQRFLADLECVRVLWPEARLCSQNVKGIPGSIEDKGLSIDWIEADAIDKDEKIFILTTGEHGIEAFVGSAVLQMFIEKLLPGFNPHTTGLLLVHAINPWGMKNYRRTNAANVDLNRNFVLHTSDLDPKFNAEYTQLIPILNPAHRLDILFSSDLAFYSRFLAIAAFRGASELRRAALLGQYNFPQGICYGGDEIQPETALMTNLYHRALENYRQVVLLDVHTGYGPRYQMSLVNSYLEPRSSTRLGKEFCYPQVVKSTPEEFYSIHGDMIDFVYNLWQEEFPERRLYAASFEFGTLGNSALASLRSMRITVLENQVYWHGAKNKGLRDHVHRDYLELFAPVETRWRAKAVEDAARAFTGILQAEGFIR